MANFSGNFVGGTSPSAARDVGVSWDLRKTTRLAALGDVPPTILCRNSYHTNLPEKFPALER